MYDLYLSKIDKHIWAIMFEDMVISVHYTIGDAKRALAMQLEVV